MQRLQKEIRASMLKGNGGKPDYDEEDIYEDEDVSGGGPVGGRATLRRPNMRLRGAMTSNYGGARTRISESRAYKKFGKFDRNEVPKEVRGDKARGKKVSWSYRVPKDEVRPGKYETRYNQKGKRSLSELAKEKLAISNEVNRTITDYVTYNSTEVKSPFSRDERTMILKLVLGSLSDYPSEEEIYETVADQIDDYFERPEEYDEFLDMIATKRYNKSMNKKLKKLDKLEAEYSSRKFKRF